MRKLAILFTLTVSAAAHAAITGTIVDADAKPVAGATIRLFAAEDSTAMRARLVAGKLDREPVATGQSAENGSFSIAVKNAAAAALDVTIEAPAFAPTTIATVDGDDLGAIVLGPPSQRQVRITSGGKPVANAILVSGLKVSRATASGEVPSPGGNTLYAVHPDYAIAHADGTSETEIKLSRGVAVHGRVVKGSGPVAHAVVSVDGWPLAESGDDGTFTIAHAPDKWQSVSAVRGNEVGAASHSKAASVEIRLGAAATFTGTLRDPKRGSAVAGARMVLSGVDDLSVIALTDSKGSFTFGPLLPRSYQIGGLHPGYVVESGGVTLPATRSRTFAAHPFARAKGRVVDEDHKPVAAALVSANGNGSARGWLAVTAAGGEFALRVPPVATIPLPIYAAKRDYVTGTSAPRIWQPGDVRDDLVITLAHGFVAQVRVVDKQQQPVPNAQVNVTRSGQGQDRGVQLGCADPTRPDCHRTGVDGLISVRTTEGRHDLMVFGDDVAPARLPNQLLTARASTIVVHVDRGVEISGRVVLADGTPVADAIIEAPTTIMRRSATSAADGTFRIAGIAAGSATLTAHSSDRRLSSTPVRVDAPAKNVTITMPQGARIEGRILDRATQQPVTDFTILLPPRNNGPGVMRPTGAALSSGQPIHADDGRYSLDDVPPGAVQLLVRADGYVPGSRGDITVEDGKTVTGIDIQLDRGATVSGRVTSAGAPVAGAQVRVAFLRTPSFSNAMSDADGLYSLQGVSEGDQTIEFQKTGFVILRKPLAITAGKDLQLDADLDPGRELRGQVVDRAGHGVAAVNVSTGGNFQGSVMTDGDGTFVLQGLSDGKYKVTARKDGYVSGEANDVDLPQSRPLILTLDAGATVTGRVTGIAPELFTQVVVTASGGSSRNQTYVDAGGNFSLPGLPDGRVRVDAFLTSGGSNRMAATKTIMIENGTAPPVEMNFDEGITLTGHVTRVGSPLPNVNVLFMPRTSAASGSSPSPDRQIGSAMTSADGSYTITGLASGDYDVRVTSLGIAFATKYTAASSGTFDIDMRGALLRGRVIDATSAAPLANARVSVSSRAPAFGSAITDSDGRFTIDALIDATYNLQAGHEQYATSQQQIVISNGTVPDVEVRLDQAPAVTVHIVDATTGAPVEGSVMITDPTHMFSGQLLRVDTGTYKVWLKPGSYTAGASARGYLFKTMTFTTPPADINIPLVQGGSLIIRARSAQQARLDLPGGAPQRLLGQIVQGLNGPYDSLVPGSYLLSSIGTDSSVIRSIPVTIVAGQTITIDLP